MKLYEYVVSRKQRKFSKNEYDVVEMPKSFRREEKNRTFAFDARSMLKKDELDRVLRNYSYYVMYSTSPDKSQEFLLMVIEEEESAVETMQRQIEDMQDRCCGLRGLLGRIEKEESQTA